MLWGFPNWPHRWPLWTPLCWIYPIWQIIQRVMKAEKCIFFFHTKVCWRSCSYMRNTLTLSLALHMLKYISLCCVSFNTAVNLNGKLIKASTADSCTSSSRNVALSPRELPHAEGREGEGKKTGDPHTHSIRLSTLIISAHQSEGGVIKEE